MKNKGITTGGISGSTLKMIAIITMLIDHIGVVIIYPMLMSQNASLSIHVLNRFYLISRSIGRLAFPIFCFLLVEGFFYTRNRRKYAMRLAAFALISEIPFDLAVNNTVFSMQGQNVFVTLLIGFFMMMLIQEFREKMLPKMKSNANPAQVFVPMLLFLAAAALAEWLRTDYGLWGIIAIMGMFILRSNKVYMCLFEAVYFLIFQLYAAFSFIPIWFYNGKRGWKLKYVFYLFYPGHLLLLYLIYIQWLVPYVLNKT